MPHGGALHLGARHRGHGKGGRAPHRNRDRTRQAFERAGVLRPIEQDHVALLIAQHGRRGIHAVDEERGHGDLGEGAPHPVGVHDGQADLRGRDQRGHRVPSADLHRDQGVGSPAQKRLESSQRAHLLIAPFELLYAHRRGANAAYGDHQRVVRQILRRDDGNAAPLFQQATRAELAQVRIATPSGAQDPRPDRNGLQVFNA